MMEQKISFFREKITEWGRRNVRKYPWRETADPYRILLAEMLLQRTPPEQVLPVYLEFLRRYPDFESVCNAPEGEIETLLKPLGLRWRLRNIRKAAKHIVERFGGSVPENHEDLISIPGVGEYIASAVRIFAFGHAGVVLDANTVRVTGRFFGLRIDDSSRRSKRFRDLLERAMDRNCPKIFNWSLIDLGRLICRARYPGCESCPLTPECEFNRKNKPGGIL